MDVPADEDGEMGCKKAFNLDCTLTAGSHGGYREGCLQFFHELPWAY